MKRNPTPHPLVLLATGLGVLAVSVLVAWALVSHDEQAPASGTLTGPGTSSSATPAPVAQETTVTTFPLPQAVLVYISFAKGLVDDGTIPEDAVTPAAVKEDVAREYGITLTDEQAENVVQRILA